MKLKEKCKIIARGYRICHEIAPGYIGRNSAEAMFIKLRSWGEIYLTAAVVGFITSRRELFQSLVTVALYAGLTLLFKLIESLFAGKNNRLVLRFEANIDMKFAEKCTEMDFVNLELPETFRKREEAYKYALGTYSAEGLAFIFRHSHEYLQNLFGIIIGGFACFQMLFPSKEMLQNAKQGGFYDFANSYWMLAVFLLLTAVMITLSVLVSIKAAKCYSDLLAIPEYNQKSRLRSYYNEYFINRYQLGKDIRIFKQKRLLLKEIQENMNGLFDIEFRTAHQLAKLEALSNIFLDMLTLLAYAFIILRAISGVYNTAQVTLYIMGFTNLAGSIKSFALNMERLFTISTVQLEKTFSFLDIPDEKYKGSIPTEKRDDGEYEFEFHHVSFRYPNAEKEALKDVCLKWHIGEKMALVGKNGCGKSTLVKLLCRLYDPTEGYITLNGVDIRKYNLEEYMALFSVVFQDSNVFSLTVGENVAAGIDYDRERAEDCLKRAGLGTWLEKQKEGLDTYLYKDFSESGVEISGGEKQKINLARAIYKNAPFVVLDEPTAALDPISENEIYRHFNEVTGSKTAIYISHRLSSCRFCNDIIVMEKGRICERGAHEMLLQQNGVYARLWRAQAEYYRNAGGDLYV